MQVLEVKASQLDVRCSCFAGQLPRIVNLQVTPPLDANLLNSLKLGLLGEHQFLNTGLAVALCSTWLQRTGHQDIICLQQMSNLPEQFIKGLTSASLQGRDQIVADWLLNSESSGELVFYLDGAHSPESMEVCAKWFSLAVKEENEPQNWCNQQGGDSKSANTMLGNNYGKSSGKISTQTDFCIASPYLPTDIEKLELIDGHTSLASKSLGVHFKKAPFVPNISVYYKVGSHALPPSNSQVDLSWQLALQRVWENLIQEGEDKNIDVAGDEVRDDTEACIKSCENSAVFSSLPLAIKWLRDNAQQNRSVRFQVLVTGSLHLMGDVLRLVKR
ncbi:folylpolyglutamate synthase-like [Syzygium oleosum]|uniref:folylpolyglutamate synthase-like n=1 Tax=Syzygium oleosum TaxID=219896 RepID=UPI0024BBE3B4|nr:folylpolyglutamate synthase-like [Syzygium oleosum]